MRPSLRRVEVKRHLPDVSAEVMLSYSPAKIEYACGDWRVLSAFSDLEADRMRRVASKTTLSFTVSV